jgi:TolB-like protein/tetratricopeptide (TPR) repeat protein
MQSELHDYLQESLGDVYAVERELGGGGMSRVFLAVERSLGRRVVIKALPPELFSGVSLSRFRREILVTANLQHPHILPVLAVGERDDLHYYVTPYIEGHSLRERLRLDGPLSVSETVVILREVAGALAYAHDRGVIHRDVKPENVLLSGGHAVLADFGIARALEQAAQHGERLTAAGLGMGTPGYMAPEQLAGDLTIDARADVFALGVLGYEMLTGKPPFTGPTAHAIAAAYFTETPAALEQLRPEVSPALSATIQRALARTPEGRFATAGEFRDALPFATDGVSSVGRKQRRRRRLVRSALLVCAALIIGALAQRFGQRAHEGMPERKTLAVLPFKNLGPPEDAYFAEGVTDELTSRLASIAGLGVISRTSADQYRGSTKPLRQIADELGANYVLEGSVRWERSPNGLGRVRVTPQLIRVRDDSHLWADRYDAEMSDVFTVQSSIAEKVAGALAIALASTERHHLGAHPTQDVAAYETYMRGMRLMEREGSNPGSLTRATELLDSAAKADPRFALSIAMLALAHLRMYGGFVDHTPTRLARARALADSALALDPILPEGHLALGAYFEERGAFDRAGAEYAIAERGRPSDPTILGTTGGLLARRGEWGEAFKRLRRAADLDPRNSEANLAAAEAAVLARDYRAASHYAEKGLVADSESVNPYISKARIALIAGDWTQARHTMRQTVLRFGAERSAAAEGFDAALASLDSTDLATLAHVGISAFAGNRIIYYYWRIELFERWRPAMARVYVDSLLREGKSLIRGPDTEAEVTSAVAWMYSVLGRRDSALVYARRTLELMPKSRDALLWANAAQMMAGVYVRTGDLDAATDLLDELLSAPSWVSVPLLRTDPFWAPLRGRPWFEQMLARHS